MRVLVALLLCVISATFAAENQTSFLIDHRNAFPGEFPFMVSLQILLFGQTAHQCGGAIISPVWIISNAHCINELPRAGTIEIHLGRHNLAIRNEAGSRFHSVSRTITHPNFPLFGANQPNDIALVRLFNAIVYTDRIRAIRLPQPQIVPIGVTTFVGWGGFGIGADILRKTTLITIPVSECRNAVNSLNFASTLDDNLNVCTGPLTGDFSLCRGDFGGPLIQGTAPNEVLVGIGSWVVTPCGTVGSPSGIYTQVSAFTDWITQQTGIIP